MTCCRWAWCPMAVAVRRRDWLVRASSLDRPRGPPPGRCQPPRASTVCARCKPRARCRRPPARQGDFSVIVRCRGELKARRSVQITAPVNVPSLRIVWQAPPGSAVKEGDPVVRFDPSSTQQQLQEKEAALKQAQATLDQAVADARITAEQDQRDLSTRKVRRRKSQDGGLQSRDRQQAARRREPHRSGAWRSRSCAYKRPPSTCTPLPTKPRSHRSRASATRRRPKWTSPITACRKWS